MPIYAIFVPLNLIIMWSSMELIFLPKKHGHAKDTPTCVSVCCEETIFVYFYFFKSFSFRYVSKDFDRCCYFQNLKININMPIHK